jgi:hypothetical protein
MGKRGPKPVDIGLLNVWEFEWYKAFHLLRDGLELPYHRAEKLRWIERAVNRARLRDLEKTPVVDYYRDLLKAEFHTPEEESLIVQNPANLAWAEKEQQKEVAWLKSSLQPRQIEKAAEGRKIWNGLVAAQALPALKETCDSWARLRNLRSGSSSYFPADFHILANTDQFFSMKRNVRFPRSDSASDSRLEFLARGMAGVLADVSPMTAIERLRNMKHASGGPLWSATANHCDCWRCGLERSNRVYETLEKAYKEELAP